MINRCNLCKDNEALADHILIHCARTRELWTFLLSSFGLVWVFLDLVRNLLLEWKVKDLGKKRRVVWRLVPICLFWYIWVERNQITLPRGRVVRPKFEEPLFLFTFKVVPAVFGFNRFLFSEFFGWLAFSRSRFFLSFCSRVLALLVYYLYT